MTRFSHRRASRAGTRRGSSPLGLLADSVSTVTSSRSCEPEHCEPALEAFFILRVSARPVSSGGDPAERRTEFGLDGDK